MKRPACLVGCCLILFLGLLFYLKPPGPYSDASIPGRSMTLTGKVTDKYSKNSGSYLMIDRAGKVSGEDPKEKHKVIVKLKESSESLAMLPPIGSAVKVEGKGMLFSGARNPGNFDLAQYEMIRGVDFEIYNADIVEVRKKGSSLNPDELLCLLRERLSYSIDRIYDEEEAGIIKAMLLGDRTGLQEEIRSGFRRSGMSHILCISSLHITLLGMAFLRLLRKTGLKKGISYVMSFTVILLYGRLTGSGVSTVRALITFFLMMAADLAGRTSDLLSSMSIAAVIILAFRPLYVLDPGFILSFTAVSGIGILSPPVKRLLPRSRGICDAAATSLGVTLFMLPVTLYFFFQIPVFSALINLVVIPLMGILLPSAVAAMAAGCFAAAPGLIAAVPSKLILSLYFFIARLNDMVPFSQLTPGRPAVRQMLLYYAGIITFVFIMEKAEKPGFRVRLSGTALLALAVLVLTIHLRAPLSMTMIDVGQGDCHLIETGGRTVMIDCGSSDIDSVARYRVAPYVLSRGYDRIDYAVLTHPDEDHISGYLELLDMGSESGLRIGCFIIPDVPCESENMELLLEKAGERGIRVMKIKAGDSFHVGRAGFYCLNPDEGARYQDMNEISVCLSIELKGSSFKALYTGDAEGDGERAMMRQLAAYKGRYALLKCAHHGSQNSTPMELLDMISPAYSFISAGVDNRYGHPHEELLQRLEDSGSRIHVTKEEGAVRMDTNGQDIRVTYYLKRKEKG